MKFSKFFSRLFVFSFCIFHFALQATPVLFPLKSFFYGANYTRGITITAVRPWLTDGNSIYAGSFITLTPTGDTNPIIELAPNDYTVALADVRTPLRFSVPDTNVVMNVLTLISNGLSSYTPVIIGNAPVTAGFGLTSTGSGTNNNLSVNTGQIATNNQPVSLAQLPAQVMTTANVYATNILSSLATPYANEENPMPAFYISWNRYGDSFNGTLLTNLVNDMAYYGSIIQNMAPFIVIIDDGWQAATRDAKGRLQMNATKWPDTPNRYTEFLRNNNMYMMLYTEPAEPTSAGYLGSVGTNLTYDAQTMADWGMIGAKVDHPARNLGPDPGGLVSAGVYKEFVHAFRSRTTNGPSYFLFDSAASETDLTNINNGLFNSIVSSVSWRPTPEFSATPGVGDNGTNSRYLAGLKKWDIDFENFSVLRNKRNWTFFSEFNNWDVPPLHSTWAGIYAVAGEPLVYIVLIAESADQARTITNREFLQMNLDPAHNPVQLVRTSGSKSTYQVYFREMVNGDKAVLLLNRSTNTAYNIPVMWTNIGFNANQLLKVRDVYYQTNVGNFTRGFTYSVGPMNSLLVRISPTIDASSIVGSLSVNQSHFELSWYLDTFPDPVATSAAGTQGESPGPEYTPDCLYQNTTTTPISRFVRVPAWASSVSGSYRISGQYAGNMTNLIQMRGFDGGSRSYGVPSNIVVSVSAATSTTVPFTYWLGSKTNRVLYFSLAANTNGQKQLTGPLILDFQ